MRRSLGLATLIGLSFSGAAYADPALTVMNTNMRVAPDSRSAIVQAIPANAEIDVSDCGNVWCGASWRDLAGYVRMSALSFDDNAQPAPPPDQPVYDYPPAAPQVIIPFGLGFGNNQGYDRGRNDRGDNRGQNVRIPQGQPPQAQPPRAPAGQPSGHGNGVGKPAPGQPWDPSNGTNQGAHR